MQCHVPPFSNETKNNIISIGVNPDYRCSVNNSTNSVKLHMPAPTQPIMYVAIVAQQKTIHIVTERPDQKEIH
jgi:hypothetical protein